MATYSIVQHTTEMFGVVDVRDEALSLALGVCERIQICSVRSHRSASEFQRHLWWKNCAVELALLAGAGDRVCVCEFWWVKQLAMGPM